MCLRQMLSALFGVAVLSAAPAFAAPGAAAEGGRPEIRAAAAADVTADMEFLLQAGRANALELAAARLALDVSRDVRVRQFAVDLVRGHAAAGLELQRLAAKRGLGKPPAVGAPQAARAFGLEGLRGSAFDRRFAARAGVQAHREAVALYRQQAAQGRDAPIVRLAADDLPRLRMHLARAEALEAQLELQRRNAPRLR